MRLERRSGSCPVEGCSTARGPWVVKGLKTIDGGKTVDLSQLGGEVVGFEQWFGVF